MCKQFFFPVIEMLFISSYRVGLSVEWYLKVMLDFHLLYSGCEYLLTTLSPHLFFSLDVLKGQTQIYSVFIQNVIKHMAIPIHLL